MAQLSPSNEYSAVPGAGPAARSTGFVHVFTTEGLWQVYDKKKHLVLNKKTAKKQ